MEVNCFFIATRQVCLCAFFFPSVSYGKQGTVESSMKAGDNIMVAFLDLL